jgi:putative methionine-R-sulfoxide reductase with GAF domain
MVSKSAPISPDWPVWYDPSAPLGSAVRYLAALSPFFHWVGIYEVKGKWLVLGPSLGEAARKARLPAGKGASGRSVPVRSRRGREVARIEIDCEAPDGFGPKEDAAVRKVAQELGELWPA